MDSISSNSSVQTSCTGLLWSFGFTNSVTPNFFAVERKLSRSNYERATQATSLTSKKMNLARTLITDRTSRQSARSIIFARKLRVKFLVLWFLHFSECYL